MVGLIPLRLASVRYSRSPTKNRDRYSLGAERPPPLCLPVKPKSSAEGTTTRLGKKISGEKDLEDTTQTGEKGEQPESKEGKEKRERPGPVTDLVIYPTTNAEWRIVMEEITQLHRKQQYKQCSARCLQILENVKDPYKVHPLYTIYISFYLASSLENTARALHPTAPQKLSLFQQSLQHYDNAESLIEYAACSADPSLIKAAANRRYSWNSSLRSSSIRSSVDSVFSSDPGWRGSVGGSSCDSAMPSPAEEKRWEYAPDADEMLAMRREMENIKLTPTPLRVNKVTFSFSPRTATIHESRTNNSLADAHLLDHFPSPPTSPSPRQTTFEGALATGVQAPTAEKEESPGSIAAFTLSRSLQRYRGHLADLRVQLNYHVGAVNAQIHLLEVQRKARRSNLPNLFTEFDAAAAAAAAGGESGDREVLEQESRGGRKEGPRERIARLRKRAEAEGGVKEELKERIARLKATGWDRPRFDGTKYQELCRKAVEEMN